MEGTNVPESRPAFIERKRAELKLFFADGNFPPNVIDKVIENELKPLTDGEVEKDRPYIAASAPGPVKSEYEVMTGQPFTKVGDHSEPLTTAKIKEMLKDNPILEEKAKEIQIVINSEANNKDIVVPLNEIKILDYGDMKAELESAEGDIEKTKRIKYRNMQVLMNAAVDYKDKSNLGDIKLTKEEEKNDEESDDEEFEKIDKAVTKYTNKSYETRFQETKEMLRQLADSYEEPDSTNNNKDKPSKLKLEEHPILKEASSCEIKGRRQNTFFEEIKESYAINEVLNISLKSNPVALELRKDAKEEEIESNNEDKYFADEEVCSNSFEVKLKDTEKALQEIDLILTNNDESKFNPNDSNISDVFESADEDELLDSKLQDMKLIQQNNKMKFDEKMETTLHNTLQTIFESKNSDNIENNELEFKEMKALARNIVEGAESLKTFIKEDITNKLNSMNELLNDVNATLENSRKSNIAYQKMKEEGEAYQKTMEEGGVRKRVKEIEASQLEELHTDIHRNIKPNDNEKESVSLLDIDGIHNAISNLNDEIKCHENRINQSKANYEVRNKECQDFIKEVDAMLQKSQEILHPKATNLNNDKLKTESNISVNNQDGDSEKACDTNYTQSVKEGTGGRKELWDIDILSKGDTNKKVADFKQQELDRGKRIDNLLYDIKDKMKDNKEVLRLANNLLRREENKKKPLTTSKIRELPFIENDKKAKGDYVDNNQLLEENKDKFEMSCIPPLEVKAEKDEDEKRKAEAEKQKQREFQIKIEKELEEINRGPRMTKQFIKNHCKQHKLYSTPYLNDILYLHFKGFSKIENLEEYTGLKCIFLENNGIQRIEGLDTLSELKCLYLHYNVLRKIENLEGCPKLDTLNLDHNFVTKIENLDAVPDLHTLSMAHNMLSSVDDLEHLRHCRNLSVVDLSYNRLEDPLIVNVLADMAVLKVLVLTGNPVVRNIPAYRKTLTLRLKELLNLDNRPVFPRDRACAEAWQRGGVHEEIAERRRWIERDQEKVMQSVRYLINMRDENRAKREAREREERETLGLPAVVMKEEDDDKTEEPGSNEGSATELVRTKEGVSEVMLSGSEADDTTSDSSSESDTNGKDEDGETMKVEWSQVDRGKRLIQELEEEQPVEDQWAGFMAGSTVPGDKNCISDLNAINDLLFKQEPHTDKNNMSKVLEEHDNKHDDAIVSERNTESLTSQEAKRKPLIEILEEYTNKSLLNDRIVEENKDNDINKGIIEDGNLIIDLNKKLAFEKETNHILKETNTEQSNVSDRRNRKLKVIHIKETNEPKDNNETEKNNTKEEKAGTGSTKADAKQGNQVQAIPSTSSQSTGRLHQSSTQGGGDGEFVNSRNRMKSRAIYDVEDPELQPSAEDLEIFAELERKELEKEARVARGEPAIDPMKLYDRKTMEAYHKAQEPEQAHALTEKHYVTTYNTDNAFDRAALSQLTAWDTPDENKVKLTHVPGAVLLQYVDQQTPTEMEYEIGEEKIESTTSSPDTDSINISSDTDTSSSDVKLESTKQSTKQTKTRPRTVKSKIDIKPTNDKETSGRKDQTYEKEHKSYEGISGSQSERYEVEHDIKCSDIRSNVKEVNEELASQYNNMCSSSSNVRMSHVERSDAKRCIIDTINSYDDERFPSQGVNYSNMDENARIEDSVATEILNKTLKYEEQELYRQIDVVTSHASRVDNQTNAIIEQISDELDHECTLPEVSQILEAHVEQRWRMEMYENFIPSPEDSDEDEDTLVTSHESSASEDTLTEDDGKERPVGAEANDSGICNKYNVTDKVIDKINNDKTTKESGDKDNVAKDISKDGNKVTKDLIDTNDESSSIDKETKDERRRRKNISKESDDEDSVVTDRPNDENKVTNDLTDNKVRSNDINKITKDEHDEELKISKESDEKIKETGSSPKTIDVRANISADDEIFEDCVDDIDAMNTGAEKDYKRVETNYTLEMKLALGINKDA
ncbi:dynein axonemal assembly factor 1 homolog [Maniola hyperantus]|uniref:dynein axonemal assembly factor 1 homolog n=1 Tax=Aphantopus hyperantus TaxID=2795564 RepID=UPI001569D2E3|nr:dynein assembly factor 1, axonemal homolog [Maniola hyperantus]